MLMRQPQSISDYHLVLVLYVSNFIKVSLLVHSAFDGVRHASVKRSELRRW
jgi:hypothetical protein